MATLPQQYLAKAFLSKDWVIKGRAAARVDQTDLAAVGVLRNQPLGGRLAV